MLVERFGAVEPVIAVSDSDDFGERDDDRLGTSVGDDELAGQHASIVERDIGTQRFCDCGRVGDAVLEPAATSDHRDARARLRAARAHSDAARPLGAKSGDHL